MRSAVISSSIYPETEAFSYLASDSDFSMYYLVASLIKISKEASGLDQLGNTSSRTVTEVKQR